MNAGSTTCRLRALGRPIWVAAIYTIVLRAAYALYALWSHLSIDPRLVSSNSFTGHLMTPGNRFLDATLGVWERFDTLWYLHIAQYGYDRPAAVVFYPLYPWLIRVVSWLVHSPLLAALAISTAASFFFFWGLQTLVEMDVPRSAAIRTVYLAGVWPASFMLFAGYADSMVLAFSVWSVYFARKGRWPLAGLLGMFAGAAKAVGCLVAVPLAFLGWRQKTWHAWMAVLCVLPLLAFSTWARLSGLGSIPDAYSQYWRTSGAFPLVTLAQSANRFTSGGLDLLFKLNFAFFAAVCCLALFKRVRVEYRLYAAALLLAFLCKKTDPLLQSTLRYVVVVFPAFIGLACLVKRPLGLVALSFVLLLVNGILLLKFFEWSLVV